MPHNKQPPYDKGHFLPYGGFYVEAICMLQLREIYFYSLREHASVANKDRTRSLPLLECIGIYFRHTTSRNFGTCSHTGKFDS